MILRQVFDWTMRTLSQAAWPGSTTYFCSHDRFILPWAEFSRAFNAIFLRNSSSLKSVPENRFSYTLWKALRSPNAFTSNYVGSFWHFFFFWQKTILLEGKFIKILLNLLFFLIFTIQFLMFQKNVNLVAAVIIVHLVIRFSIRGCRMIIWDALYQINI